MSNQNQSWNDLDQTKPINFAKIFAEVAVELGMSLDDPGETDPRDTALMTAMSEMSVASYWAKLGFLDSLRLKRLVKKARKHEVAYRNAKSLHAAHLALGKSLMSAGSAIALSNIRQLTNSDFHDLGMIVQRDPALTREPNDEDVDPVLKLTATGDSFEMVVLKASMSATGELDAIVESIEFSKIESVKLTLLEMAAKITFIRLSKAELDFGKKLKMLGMLFYLTGKIGELAEERQQQLRRIHAV